MIPHLDYGLRRRLRDSDMKRDLQQMSTSPGRETNIDQEHQEEHQILQARVSNKQHNIQKVRSMVLMQYGILYPVR